MNLLDKNIRQTLEKVMEPSEAAAVSKAVCMEVLGLTQTEFYLDKNTELSLDGQERLRQVLERLTKGEPLAYVLGYQYFMGRSFALNRDTLIPRPETADLVSAAREILRSGHEVLDIGCGSGCISLTLALEVPGCHVTGLDISEGALEMCRVNQEALGASCHWLKADILRDELLQDAYDVIVSNPPYVLDSEKAEMQSQVLDWEPSRALFVPDSDPLLFYRVIAQKARKALRRGGYLLYEINRRFGRETLEMLQGMGFADLQLRKDIEGQDRVVVARWPD